GFVPCPSWSDAGWLCVFPFLISGVLLLCNSIPNAGRARLLLDSAIATGSVGIPVWHFLLRPLWQHSGLQFFGKVVSFSYPLGDIAALFSAIVLINSVTEGHVQRRPMKLLACGIILWSLSDTLYTYARFLGSYHMGSWFDG